MVLDSSLQEYSEKNNFINMQPPYYYDDDWFMMFNATFKNISVILWQSVLLVEETTVPGENHHPAVTDTLYHIMLYRVHVKNQLITGK
jgi:hypothetical protein